MRIHRIVVMNERYYPLVALLRKRGVNGNLVETSDEWETGRKYMTVMEYQALR